VKLIINSLSFRRKPESLKDPDFRRDDIGIKGTQYLIPTTCHSRERGNPRIKYCVPLILIALGMYLLPVKAYGDVKTVQPKVAEVTGEVSQIDSVGGVVVLQTINALGVPQEVKFYVNNNTKSIGGNAHLMDVNVSDWVTIRFTVDSSGNNVIVKLTDDNISNNPI
jgi:hypothetical protein